MDTGLLVIRVVFGVLMAMHGSQKLFGWFGGYGLNAVAGYFDGLGFKPGRLFAVVAATSELFAGLLIALGFLGPIGPALMVSVMIVAAGSVHWPNGLFASNNGIEVPLLYAVVGAGLALTGPGAFSLDGLVGLRALSTATVVWPALVIAVAGGVGNLAVRRPTPATA